VAFDDPNLVSAAGLVPVLALADGAGLRRLADEHLSVPTDKGAHAGLKVASLVAGMVAGADSIDDMALLRHGGMGRIFAWAYAPSTLGSFLRAFTFGHVRQLDAVAARFLLALARLVGLAPRLPQAGDTGGYAFLDVDDTIIEVHGHAKQGAGFGYTRVRGLNALLATLTTSSSAPLVVAQRLRKGGCGSPRGAKRLVGDAVKQARRLLGPGQGILVRMDSAYYGRDAVHAAITGGAHVSVTVRANSPVKAAIAGIGDDAWTTVKYPDAILDASTGTWISKAEVAEVPFTAFASRKSRSGARPAGRAPDPGRARRSEEGRRAGHLVRHVALPRVLHHRPRRHGGHRRRGQDSPRTRHHRTGPRRPKELRTGAPALREVHRERRLARARGHRVQPHPRRRQPDRGAPARESDHRDGPSQADPRPRPGRVLRAPDHPAPA
jgi:hypothetical protein